MKAYLFLFVCAVLLTGCMSGDETSGPPDGTGISPRAESLDPAESGAVLTRIDSYYDAMSERDWDLWAQHFWPGATLAFVFPDSTGQVHGVTFQSIEEFIAQTPMGPDSREIFEERRSGGSVTIEGDVAVGLIPFHARFGDPGDIMEWDGTDAFTLMRVDGVWNITHLAFVPELE